MSILSSFSLQVVSWCGTRESGTVLDVTGSLVVVSFTTDSSATDSGFNISMEFVNSSKWDSFQQMFVQYIIIKINKLKEKGEINVLDSLFFLWRFHQRKPKKVKCPSVIRCVIYFVAIFPIFERFCVALSINKTFLTLNVKL